MFKNRAEAGRMLAEKLSRYKDEDVVVYAIPPGGIVVAREIARSMKASLGCIVTRRIAHPFDSTYTIGAVAEDGHFIKNSADEIFVSPIWFKERINEEAKEARRRRALYCGKYGKISAINKTAILVDEGVETSLVFSLAIQELRDMQPKRIIAAIPVVPFAEATRIKETVDEIVAIHTPFYGDLGIEKYYDDFSSIDDEDVAGMLRQASN